MHQNELEAVFDRAYALMLEGNFIAATAYFQRVIEEATDRRAREIAKRDLDWWCVPYDLMRKRLEITSYPLALKDLLSEAKDLQDTTQYIRYSHAVSSALKQDTKIRTLGDGLWIYQNHLDIALESMVAKLRVTRMPKTLVEFAQELFSQHRGEALFKGQAFMDAIREALSDIEGVHVLDIDCVFEKNGLGDLQHALIESSRHVKRPISLQATVAAMPWPEVVKSQLNLSDLEHWLIRHADKSLSEITDDWWIAEGAFDLASVPFEDLIGAQITPLQTEAIVSLCLFGDKPPPGHIAGNFLREQHMRLTANTSLLPLDSGYWLLKSTAKKLLDDSVFALAKSDRPRTFEWLAESTNMLSSPSFQARALLESNLHLWLNQDVRVIEVVDDVWLHKMSMHSVVNRACILLADDTPRTIQQLLEECLGYKVNVRKCKSRFLAEFEATLNQEAHLIRHDLTRTWAVFPKGNRINNLAYTILFQEHRPLGRQQIIDVAKQSPHTNTLDFRLDSDVRFRQLADGRWILAHWVLINDLAAIYLANSPIPLNSTTITQRVCDAHNLRIADAIFIPDGDPRFISKAFGKWFCSSPGKLISPELIEKLVQFSDSIDSGVSLEVLVRKAIRDVPSSFYELAETLLKDGRLINCDGLWYSRSKFEYRVSLDDLAKTRIYITQIGYPVSATVLSEKCFGRPLCLTDLEAHLAASAEFKDLGSAGWIVQGLQPETVGRQRNINYPVRSGEYLPSLPDELLSQIDEEETRLLPLSPGKTDQSRHPRHIRRLTVTLTFEDVRDGSLNVTSSLQRFLGESSESSAFLFVDDAGNEFSCWNDTVHNLVHGFGQWFASNTLSFGDKIRLFPTDIASKFRIQTTGERDEQVYLEGLRHSQIQSLLDEALTAKRSYHDLIMEVLEFFGTPLHVDDLWSMVSYRRAARKATLAAILSSRQRYFVPDGSGFWHLDKEGYARMIRELERQLRMLTSENDSLRGDIARMNEEVVAIKTPPEQIAQMQSQVEMSETKLRNAMREAEAIIQDRDALQSQVDELSVETRSLRETLAQKLVMLSESEGRLRASQADNAQLTQQLLKLTTALQGLRGELDDAIRSHAQLEDRLERMESQRQTLGAQIGALSDQVESLQLEFTRAWRVLDLWSGKLALWIAKFRGLDLPARVRHGLHLGESPQ